MISQYLGYITRYTVPPFFSLHGRQTATARNGGMEGVNYGVGSYGMELVHNRQPERSRVTS